MDATYYELMVRLIGKALNISNWATDDISALERNMKNYSPDVSSALKEYWAKLDECEKNPSQGEGDIRDKAHAKLLSEIMKASA